MIERLGGSGRALRLSARTARNSGARRFHRRDAGKSRAIASSAIRRSAFRSDYIHRDNREGFKAGALQEGLEDPRPANSSPFSTPISSRPRIFCAAPCPISWIPKLAMVQTRWSYINRHYSALTEVEAILLDGHFVIEHSSRFRSGAVFQFQRHGGHLAARARSRMRAAGSTTRSPKTPIFPIARSFAAGNFSICRKSNALPNCPWR